MSGKISFFSELDISKISGDRFHCLGRISEGYWSFHKVSCVATRIDSNGMIRFAEETTKREGGYLMTAFKIASFATIIFPLFMAAAKLIYRLSNRLISENIVDGTLIRKLPIDLIKVILGRVDPKTLHEMVPDGKMALRRDPNDKLAKALKFVYQEQKLRHMLHNIDIFRRDLKFSSTNLGHPVTSVTVTPDGKIVQVGSSGAGVIGVYDCIYECIEVDLWIRPSVWDANEATFVFQEERPWFDSTGIEVIRPSSGKRKAAKTYLAPHLDLLNRLARGACQIAKEKSINDFHHFLFIGDWVVSGGYIVFKNVKDYPVSMLLEAAERNVCVSQVPPELDCHLWDEEYLAAARFPYKR